LETTVTAAGLSSFCYSAAADSAETMTVDALALALAEATIAAAKPYFLLILTKNSAGIPAEFCFFDSESYAAAASL
jgi:hypothetical protein